MDKLCGIHTQRCRHQAGWVCGLGRSGTVQIPAPGVLLSTWTHTAAEVRQQFPPRLALSAEPGTEEPPGDLQFPPELPFLEVKCWKSARQALTSKLCDLGKLSLSTHNFSFREKLSFRRHF